MKVYLAYVEGEREHYVDEVFDSEEKAIQHLIQRKYSHWWYKDKKVSDVDKRNSVISKVVEMEVK